ncbi:MAG: hypothetical protein J5I52_08500 [Saprospiraceae bacterium]|nr:MAG: DNA polymerase III gamma/tau subunit-like protein [Bacteroidetes bacterium OLB9]MCO6464175.1 hypothetical protein [Saprospiraceae bacterium]MCZ2338505.1 hypothetical protein [Chitinophagales bacterium]
MFFKSIPGKSEVKKQLVSAVDKNRIPHAQLFLSKEGYGALAMALALAAYITCEDKKNGDSCGVCKQCLKSHKWIHPDIHFSYPVVKFGDKKRESTTSDDFLPKWREALSKNSFMGHSDWFDLMDAQNSLPNINVKECNDIIHKLSMMSFESEAKILIMWLPEYLGNNGNRLLKLIEEPTDHTYIILVAEQQELILQTILSRCQIVKIPSFSNDEITRYLLEQNNTLQRSTAEQIANLSDGNLNLAIAISNNEDVDYSDLLISWFRIAYKADPVEINAWIKTIDGMEKEEQKNFLEYGLHFFRQYNYRLLTQSDNIQLTKKEKEIASKMANIIDIEKSTEICEVINTTANRVSSNINLKITLFADTLHIHRILRSK